MKVLMTTDAVGGVWTYALQLCAALEQYQVSVMLAVLGPAPTHSQLAAAQRLPNVTVEHAAYRLEWMTEAWSDVEAAGRWLLRLADTAAVDLIHLNGYVHAALPWRRPVVTVAHSCVESWWRAVHGATAPREWDMYRYRVREGLRAANLVVSPTHAFLQVLRECHAFDTRAIVIRNGVPHRPMPQAQLQQPQILACGRLWDDAKNFATLDAAAASVPWPVALAGATHSPSNTAWQPKMLRCLGALSAVELEAAMRRATLFVHPARYEPFGLAVLEAAQANCALVLADIPTLRELWSDAAEFFAPQDTEALARTLRTLIASPATVTYRAAQAYQRAQQFTAAAMGASYHREYRGLFNAVRAVA